MQTTTRPDNRLKAIRTQRGYILQLLALEANCSVNTLTLIERYNHCPRPEVRARIARALDCDPTDIWPALAEGKAS